MFQSGRAIVLAGGLVDGKEAVTFLVRVKENIEFPGGPFELPLAPAEFL